MTTDVLVDIASRVTNSPKMPLGLRQGVVVSIDTTAGTLVVRLAGSATGIPGVRYLEGAAVVAGDTVWVLENGTDYLVMGKLHAGGSQGNTINLLGLDLYHVSSTPHIDFHRAYNPAGDSNADYNMRIINDAAGTLSVLGGTLVINSAAATNVKSIGAGAGFQFSERDGEGDWAWYSNADRAHLWRSAYGDVVTVEPQGRIQTGIAKIGTHPIHGSYAWFGHKDFTGSTQYGFLQGNDGYTYINSTANTCIALNGNWVCRLDASGFYVADDLAIPSDRAIYFKGPWDATHMIHHSSADDGFRYSSWNYHRWWLRGAEVGRFQFHDGLYLYYGWFRTHGDNGIYNESRAQGVQFTPDGVRTYPNGMRFDAYLFDHLGAWTVCPIWVRSDGGGSGARITHRAAGQNAAPMWKAWGQAFEARSWDDGAMIPIRGVIENYCRAESKSNIRAAEARLPKAQRKQKVKALRTVHYNREKRGQGCANCLGTGEATKNERIKSALYEKQRHAKDDRPDKDKRPKKPLPKEIADVVEPVEGEPCPDCNGQGLAWERPENKKAEEAGWFGFVAEEVVEQFPEAMFFRHDEDGEVRVSGVDHMALIAILWEEIKDLEERLDAVEKKGK